MMSTWTTAAPPTYSVPSTMRASTSPFNVVSVIGPALTAFTASAARDIVLDAAHAADPGSLVPSVADARAARDAQGGAERVRSYTCVVQDIESVAT